MFPFAATILLAGGPIPEVIATTKGLELSLNVIEAFENGPVILDVSITNRGEKPIWLDGTFGEASSLRLPAAWKRESRNRHPSICGGLFTQKPGKPLNSGTSHTERWTLHDGYRGRFPAGTHSVTVGWLLWAAGKETPVRLNAEVQKTFAVTITPATPANRYALAARLEVEFAALPPASRNDLDGDLTTPFGWLWIRAIHTPHPELVPVVIKLLDRVNSLSDPSYPGMSKTLVETLFDMDPRTAHRVCVDRLLASPSQLPPELLLPMLAEPENTFSCFWPRLSVIADPRYWLDPVYRKRRIWTPIDDAVSFIPWAIHLAPRTLPENELLRLATAKEFWVRAWVYETFANRLGAEWCDAFLRDARRWAEKSPDPKIKSAELGPQAERLFRMMWPQNVADRRLLEAFAAGAADNPYAIAARKKLEPEPDEK